MYRSLKDTYKEFLMTSWNIMIVQKKKKKQKKQTKNPECKIVFSTGKKSLLAAPIHQHFL